MRPVALSLLAGFLAGSPVLFQACTSAQRKTADDARAALVQVCAFVDERIRYAEVNRACAAFIAAERELDAGAGGAP